VIPAHNAAATIGAALESVLWQTISDLEVIVVDDGSTDETAAIVSAHSDPRIRTLRQEQQGQSAARNHGIGEAAAPLVALLDADDVLFPDYLRSSLAVWRVSGGIVTSNAYWLYPGGIDPRQVRHPRRLPRPPEQRRSLLEQNWVSPMSLFPSTLVTELGGFDTRLRHLEDWDFWLRAVYAGWVVHSQPRPLALFNRSQPSMSTVRASMVAAERDLFERMRERPDLKTPERAYVELRLASPSPVELIARAEQWIAEGEYHQASGALRQAAALCPTDRALVAKARALRAAPGATGRLLRRRSERRAALQTTTAR